MNNTLDIIQPIESALVDFWSGILAYMPILIIGILILAVGYWLSKLGRGLTLKLAKQVGVGRLGDNTGATTFLEKAGIHSGLPGLLAQLVYLFLLLAFARAATDILGLHGISDTVVEFLLYTPKILAAGTILLLGFWLSQASYKATRASAESFGIDTARAIGNLVRAFVVVIAVILSVAQLEIDITFLNTLVIGLVGAVLVALGLSFGLGTRTYSSEIVAGVYVKDLYNIGDNVECGDISGEVVSFGSVCTQISRDNQIINIPNSALIKQPVVRKSNL